MRTRFPLLIALAIPLFSSFDAEAARSRFSNQERIAPGAAPAIEPAEGSLWDYIEDIEGTIPVGDVVPASEELAAERREEARFMAALAITDAPPPRFYTDPVSVLAVDPLHLDEIDPSEFDIPIVVNDDVIRWMKYFTGRGRKYYAKWLGRSSRYRPMMYEKLEAAGLPRDLVYLSMIESGYATHAYSSAAAAGLWQFITPTAREWGMRVDYWVDERRDPEMATDAAVKFLGHLNKKFGHWYLAWAAYNGGPSRVSRAISRHGTKDFYTLVARNAFPAETDNYVPKLVAAAIIGHHPERYGFTDIKYQDRLEYDEVKVGPGVSIDVLAKCAGISVEDFQYLNPHLRRFAIPPDGKKHTLRIPKGDGRQFLAALDKVPASERLTYTTHRVVKGESLGQIASRYGVSVAAIQRTNSISNPNRIYVGMELVVPTNGASPAALASATSRSGSKSKALTSSAGRSKAKTSSRKVTHVVRKGEALSTIASRYGVRTSDVMRWNGLKNANRVYVGQKLTIYDKSASWNTYTVRKGDNLGLIAKRNGCSVSDLRSWNNLSSSRIYPGQKLKVRR
jgi:membrane-bound lytic murein transglycosylase D